MGKSETHGRGEALSGAGGLRDTGPARLRKLLQRKRFASLSCGFDKKEIMIGGDFPARLPRCDRGVRLVDVLRQVGHRRPDVKNMLHTAKLRILRIMVNTQIVKCDPQAVYLELPQP